MWRRLVARYLGVVEAAGSNPVTQTSRVSQHAFRVLRRFCFFYVFSSGKNQFCIDRQNIAAQAIVRADFIVASGSAGNGLRSDLAGVGLIA